MIYIAIGVAFLLTWLLTTVFTVTLAHALLIVAIIYLLIGLFTEKAWLRR